MNMDFHLLLTIFGIVIQLPYLLARKPAAEILDGLVGYDNRLPPHGAKGPGSPVEVSVSVYMIDIIKLDDAKMELTSQMYLRQKWKDPRLRYEDGAEKLKLLNFEDLKRIWTPDLFFVDEQDAKINSVVFPNGFVKWSSDGALFISSRITITTRCQMDFTYYPHDEQTCLFNIESYAHTAENVEIKWNHGYNQGLGMTHSPHEKNFEIKNMTGSTQHETVVSGTYTRLTVNMSFDRKAGFFMTKLYIPYIVLTIVSWLSLWINAKLVQLRLSLLLSVLLIMFVLASDMNAYIPRATYTKAIDIWTAFSISFVFALLLEFIFFTKHSKEENVEEPIEIAADTNLLGKNEKDGKDFLPLRLQFIKRSLRSGSQRLSSRADEIFRWIFPPIYGLFNLIYWCTYAS